MNIPEKAAESAESEKKRYKPIPHYNPMLHEDFSMYERPTYIRDLSLFDSDEVMLERGNVIHFYECKFSEPKKIGGDAIDVEITAEEDLSDDAAEEEDSEENSEI
ncbi:MAG: hypothetical protein K2N94_06995 [Lachnospiraceae bacterium]|nr:hypothetical protein [Lachnospiraceae bacterium]